MLLVGIVMGGFIGILLSEIPLATAIGLTIGAGIDAWLNREEE